MNKGFVREVVHTTGNLLTEGEQSQRGRRGHLSHPNTLGGVTENLA